MTTPVEQAAKRHIEKAYGFGFVYDHNEMVKCYLAGHAAARAEIETEIAALKAKLAAMREPLWMLREEHEAETADLRARLEAAEARAAKWVEWDSEDRRILTKAGAVGIGDDELIGGKWHRLMVPNVPLPETEP